MPFKPFLDVFDYLFLLNILVTKIYTQILNIVDFVIYMHQISPEQDFDYIYRELMPKISKTFYLTLQRLPEDLRRDCMVAYAYYRAEDNVEDGKDVDPREKVSLMNGLVSTFSTGNVKTAVALQKRLAKVHQTKEGYAELMRNYSRVVGASKVLGEEIVDLIAEGGRQMADGLGNPVIQNIRTLADHHVYCHYAAAVVGYFITKDLVARGYISKEIAKKIMPSTHDNNPPVRSNPAHDFSVALQLTNNIRDFHDDFKNSISRWPLELLSESRLTYQTLADPKIAGAKLKSAKNILFKQIEDAKTFFPGAIDWVDGLPYEFENKNENDLAGIKESWATALVLSAATLRKIGTDKFFTNPDTRKLSHDNVRDLALIVNDLARRKQNMRSLVERILPSLS